MSAPPPARSLAELRKSYEQHLAANQGHCRDSALVQAYVAALEKELLRVDRQLDRTGTVYRMPKVPKA